MVRLNRINEVADRARLGIAGIKGKTNALTVFSAVRFPGPKKLPDFPKLHMGGGGLSTQLFGGDYDDDDEEDEDEDEDEEIGPNKPPRIPYYIGERRES